MKKGRFKFVKKILFSLSITLFLPTISFAEPPNLSVLKKQIEVYHDSGLYEKELACVVTQAQNYILQQAAANEQQGNKKKLALVLDIDETSLTNYPKMIVRGFAGNRAQFHREVLAADAPAISPVLALYRNAQQHGIQVFFITGRLRSELQATKINLMRAGFNHWAGLYLRPDNYNQSSIVPFKSQARAAIIKQGYTIVASIGDQESDLKGGFAQKGFKLPNPFYYLP